MRLRPLIALSLCGCWTSRETGQMLQAEVRALRQDAAQLRREMELGRAQALEESRANLERFETLSRNLQELNHTARSVDADFGSQLDRMVQEVQELRGAVEVTEHRIGETENRLEQSLGDRIAALQKQPAPETHEAPAGSPPLPSDKREALALANRLVKEGKLDEGRAVLRDVVKQWPKEMGISDEATFRLGDTYFTDKRYDVALREYIKVVDKFSHGNLVDDAYYKIGLCSLELGQLEDAQTFLGELVNNHPKSPLLASAKAKLEEVNRRLQQGGRGRRGGAKRRDRAAAKP